MQSSAIGSILGRVLGSAQVKPAGSVQLITIGSVLGSMFGSEQ